MCVSLCVHFCNFSITCCCLFEMHLDLYTHSHTQCYANVKASFAHKTEVPVPGHFNFVL